MLYGVGKKGKRILLSEYLNLTVQIPFGVAFEKNETESENIDYNLIKFERNPSGYKSGMFSPKGENVILWKLTGQGNCCLSQTGVPRAVWCFSRAVLPACGSGELPGSGFVCGHAQRAGKRSCIL